MLLAGCSAPPSVRPELQYFAPTGQQGTLATLVGSQDERLFFPNRTAHVFAVDNKRVMADEEGWSKALPIRPGMRNVTVSFGSESSYIFGTGGSYTKVDLQLHAVAAGSYQVQFSCEEGSYFDFWIGDIVTQKPVSGIVRWVIPVAEPMRMTI